MSTFSLRLRRSFDFLGEGGGLDIFRCYKQENMDSINSTNMSKNVNKQVTLLKREKIGINFNWTNACPDTYGNFEFCEGVCVNTTYCIPQKISWVSTF